MSAHMLIGLALAAVPLAAAQTPDRPRTFSFVYYHDPIAEAIDYRIGVLPKIKTGPDDVETYERYRHQYAAFQDELVALQPDWVRVSMILNGQLMIGGIVRPRLSAEEIREQLDQSKAKLDRLHKRLPNAKFIHYLCQVKISGDPAKRTGMFALYDHWDEYASLGLGPKPKRPMIEWVQRRGEERRLWFWRYYSLHECPCYMLCPNAPETRQLRAAQVRLLAEAGVDGIFVDNPMNCCRCDVCMKLFRKRLATKYTAAQRKRFFGEADVNKLALAPGLTANSPLAVETLHFYTESCASLFRLYKETGEVVRGKGKFVVSANGAPFEIKPNYCSNISDWAHYGLLDNAWRECRAVALGRWDRATGGPLLEVEHWDMIHAMLGCQGVGRELYASPAYNYSFIAMMPLYELAAAEHWAFGGLFLISRSRAVYGGNLPDPSLAGDARQRVLHEWFNRLRPRLWAGARSAARVAVLASHNEWLVGNAQFEPEFRVLTELLEQAQISFDILVDAGITADALAHYELAIAPCFSSIKLAQHQAVREFVRKRGRLLATGPYGAVHEVGVPRDPALLEELRGMAGVVHRPAPFTTIGGDPATAVRPIDAPLWNKYGGKRHTPRLALLAETARRPFLDAVAALLPGRLSLVGHGQAPALRSRLYAKPDALVLHLVNYDVASAWREGPVAYLPFKGTRPTVERVWNIEATVPLPAGRRVKAITLFRPGETDLDITDFTRLADGVAFRVPDVYIYAVAEIQLEPGQPESRLKLQDYAEGRAWTAPAVRPYRRAGFDLAPVPDDAPRAEAKDAPGPLMQACGYAFMHAARGERVEGAVHTASNANDERRLSLKDIASAMDMGDAAARWSARGEWVQYWVIDPNGDVILQQSVRCGESSRFAFDAVVGGTYALCVDAGTNFYRVEIPGRPLALSAVEPHRMILVDAPGRLYFRVRRGLKEVALQVQCRDKAARVRVIAPDGVRREQTLGRRFHPMARLAVAVKPDDWGAVWALEVDKAHARWPMTWFFEPGQDGLVATSPSTLLAPTE